MSRWRAERVFVLAVAVVVATQALVIANRRLEHAGDFDVSREFGRRFLAGEPLYAGGLHYPYMPAAALSFAPLALVPPALGFAVRYAAALGCLWIVLRLLHAMAVANNRAAAASRLAAAAITLVLASHYVLRDLDDAGPHLLLLAILVTGIYSIWRGHRLTAAACFGLAAALKPPNGLVIPFLVWKREWRLAAATAAAAACWILLPACWMGPASWWEHQRQWVVTAVASARGVAEGGAAASESRVQNQALRPVLERYAARLDDGIGEGAAYALAAAPPVRTPRTAVFVLSAILLAAVAWWAGRPWSAAGDPRVLPEASAVLILCLLLSPVTWVQHLVALIPALYVVVAATRGTRPDAGTLLALATYVVLALFLNRELVGRDAYISLLAYGLHTIVMLIVLVMLVNTARPPPASAP